MNAAINSKLFTDSGATAGSSVTLVLVVQWIERKPPELKTWVRLPPSTPNKKNSAVPINFGAALNLEVIIKVVKNTQRNLRPTGMSAAGVMKQDVS